MEMGQAREYLTLQDGNVKTQKKTFRMAGDGYVSLMDKCILCVYAYMEWLRLCPCLCLCLYMCAVEDIFI
jgi:hypothetical protein